MLGTDRDPRAGALADGAAPAGIGGAFAGYLERLGGIIISPATTLDSFCAGGRGGFNDLLLLLLLQAVGLGLPRLARSGWILVDGSIMTGALLMLQNIARLLIVPLGAVAVGAVLLKGVTHKARAVRHLDAAALCAVPAVSLQLLFSVAGFAAPQLYLPILRQAVLGVGALWFVALLVGAVRVIRGLDSGENVREKPG